MSKKSVSVSSAVQNAMRDYRASFMIVMAHLEASGLDCKKWPQAVGMTKHAFNAAALGAAAAHFDTACHALGAYKGEESVFALGQALTALGNAHDVLVLTGADVADDAGFAALGVDKGGFENTCRDAVLKSLVMIRDCGAQAYARFGTWDLNRAIGNCMAAGAIDRYTDHIYQDAGYESRDEFDRVCLARKSEAAQIQIGPVCAMECKP